MKTFISSFLVSLSSLAALGENGTNRIEPAFKHADKNYVNMLARQKITLSLVKMSLESVPSAITNAPFTEIDLSNNQLTEFPAELITLTNSLKVLRLNGNQIKTLPAEIGCFKKLDALHLAECPLEALPPEICELKNLSTLTLYNCHLTSLPLGMKNLMKNTSNFHVSRNQIKDFPAGFLFPNKLTSLDLSDNLLSAIPSGIPSGVKTLKINNNLLHEISDDRISRINALGCLVFNNNRVESIELKNRYPKLFRLEAKENALTDGKISIHSAPSLKHVELSSNQLESIPECLYTLPALKSLTIRGNYITNLADISGFRNLESIDLRGNNISALPNELGELPNIKKIHMKGNPIRADELKRFKDKFPHIQVDI